MYKDMDYESKEAQGPYDHGTEYPIIINGVVAAVLMAVGYLPTYYEIWTRHGKVLGISMMCLYYVYPTHD